MTFEQVDKLNPDMPNDKSWDTAIDFVRKRYYDRYLNHIPILQYHCKKEIRNNCGFIIVSIDCIIIETLQQFYEGNDETSSTTTDAYLKFFNRSPKFSSVINSQEKANIFTSQVRSGLLHQSKTKKETTINKKKNTPMLAWVDENAITKGLKINRDLFHQEVLCEFETYLRLVKKGEKQIREKFIKKLKTIVVN